MKGLLKDLAEGDSQQTNLEKTLLTWCQENTQGWVYNNVN